MNNNLYNIYKFCFLGIR